jgi:hypothetical protein
MTLLPCAKIPRYRDGFMKCFNKLLDDFVSAAANGTLCVETEEQRRICMVLAKEAAARGIVVELGKLEDSKPAVSLCNICHKQEPTNS